MKYISYQEMKIIGNKKNVEFTQMECKVKLKSPVGRKFDSKSRLLHISFVTDCLSIGKRSRQE